MLQGRRDDKTSPDSSLPKEGIIVRTFTVYLFQFQSLPAIKPCTKHQQFGQAACYNSTCCISGRRVLATKLFFLMFYTRRPDVRTQHVDGETLVLDDQNGYIHQLNPTAGFIWSQCDGKSTATEIVQRLALEFNVEDGVATKDVSDIIKRLRDLKLLRE